MEDINSRGGVLGKKLELFIGDDVCRVDVAVAMANKMVSDGAQLIVGHLCSGSTLAANKIYKEAGILVISPSSSNDDLTKSGLHPNFFRTIGYDSAQAEMMTSFVKNNLNVKKVALVHDSGDYGKGNIELVRNNFQKLGGIEVVLLQGVKSLSADFSPLVEKIKRSEAELIIWGGYDRDASKIVSQIRKRGIKTAFLGCDGIFNDRFISRTGKYAEGVYATSLVDMSSNPLSIELKAKHKKKYWKEPGSFASNAYSALKMFADAANRSGTLNSGVLKKELKANFIKTPIGEVKFDHQGDIMLKDRPVLYNSRWGVYVVKEEKFLAIQKNYYNSSN